MQMVNNNMACKDEDSSNVEENTSGGADDNLHPAVAMYGPYNIRGLEPGQKKLFCTCGLSKKQPWCDGSHKGTGIKPLKWTVPDKSQTLYLICGCKYSKDLPYCDATHVYLPLDVIKRREECKTDHASIEKLCTGCGTITVPEW